MYILLLLSYENITPSCSLKDELQCLAYGLEPSVGCRCCDTIIMKAMVKTPLQINSHNGEPRDKMNVSEN